MRKVNLLVFGIIFSVLFLPMVKAVPQFEKYNSHKQNAVLYSVGNVVKYKGSYYECVRQVYNYNGLPTELTGFWDKLQVGGGQITEDDIKALSENITSIKDIVRSSLENTTSEIKESVDRPKYGMDLMGTEYEVGNTGKIFLQLLDDNSQALSNSTCYVDIYRPENTKLVDNQKMLNLGENGLYFYTLELPMVEGVYMLSSECIIGTNAYIEVGYDGFESNGFSGGTGNWTTDWIESGTGDVSITTDSYNGSSYAMTLVGGGGFFGSEYPRVERDIKIGSETTIEFYQKLDGIESGEYYDFGIIDGNGTSTTLETWSDGEDDNIWRKWSYTLYPQDYNLDGNITLWFEGAVNYGNDELSIDNVRVSSLGQFNETKYISVKGSGEMHISGDLGGEILENTTTEIHDARDNLTYVIRDSEGNIVNRIDTAQTNLTFEIEETEQNLNTSIYDIRDYLENSILNIRNYIVSTLNASIYDIRDYLENRIMEARNFIVGNTTVEINKGEERIKENITLEIGETENNITLTIRDAEGNILDELNSTQKNLEDFLGENVTANVTAECNSREVWKYFYTHPLKSDELNNILGG